MEVCCLDALCPIHMGVKVGPYGSRSPRCVVTMRFFVADVLNVIPRSYFKYCCGLYIALLRSIYSCWELPTMCVQSQLFLDNSSFSLHANHFEIQAILLVVFEAKPPLHRIPWKRTENGWYVLMIFISCSLF